MFLTPLCTVCVLGKKSLSLPFSLMKPIFGVEVNNTRRTWKEESLRRDVVVVVVGFLPHQRACETKVCQGCESELFRVVQRQHFQKYSLQDAPLK